MLKKTLKEASSINTKHLSTHIFRHTHSSRLLMEDGIDVDYVAGQSGDTIDTINSTYRHLLNEKKGKIKKRCFKCIAIASRESALFRHFHY